MTACMKLDLPRIEATLQEFQDPVYSGSPAGAVREPLEAETIGNMVKGYRCIERFVNEGTDIFAMGGSKHLLELNRIVLCGIEMDRRRENAGHLAATERRFYEEPGAGIGDLIDWYRLNSSAPVWDLAAGVYMRILGTPQLYIEGNHRTGALVASYLLMRVAEPPFVLTRDNAADYFAASGDIRVIRKHSLRASFQFPGLLRRLAAFLRREANPAFLQAAHPTDCANPRGLMSS